MKRLHITICLLAAMLVCASAMAQRSNDTLWPKQSLRLEIAGKAILGVGVTYERAWKNLNKTRHPRAFSSLEANASFAFLEYIITSVAINRNWRVGIREKWTLSCGISPGALICLNPTPKEVREYYDANPQYGRGRYVNPIEPGLLGSISCRYQFKRMFAQASLTPFVYYDRAYNKEFVWAPWAGVSIGFNLKSKQERQLKRQSAEDENKINSE